MFTWRIFIKLVSCTPSMPSLSHATLAGLPLPSFCVGFLLFPSLLYVAASPIISHMGACELPYHYKSTCGNPNTTMAVPWRRQGLWVLTPRGWNSQDAMSVPMEDCLPFAVCNSQTVWACHQILIGLVPWSWSPELIRHKSVFCISHQVQVLCYDGTKWLRHLALILGK